MDTRSVPVIIGKAPSEARQHQLKCSLTGRTAYGAIRNVRPDASRISLSLLVIFVQRDDVMGVEIERGIENQVFRL
jgi:hypothetical protein